MRRSYINNNNNKNNNNNNNNNNNLNHNNIGRITQVGGENYLNEKTMYICSCKKWASTDEPVV